MNLRRLLSAFAALLITIVPLYPQSINLQRNFDNLFPGLNPDFRNAAFSDGVIRTITKGESFRIFPSALSGIDLQSRISEKGCHYITESLIVIPNREKPYVLLDAYNALGQIRGLKGRLYSSHTRGQDVPLFEDAVRLESDRRNNPIPDPPPALSIPSRETVYIRLRDVNFGNTFYRAEITPHGNGLLYNLTNYRNISYLFFTIMREEKFSAWLYMEPIEEGMLIYSVAGTDVTDFVASIVDIPSAISKRLLVFVDWVNDGLMRL